MKQRWYYQVSGGEWAAYKYVDIELSNYGIALVPEQVAKIVWKDLKLGLNDVVTVSSAIPQTFKAVTTIKKV